MAKKKITPRQLKAIYQKKLDFIDNSLGDFDSDLQRLQSELFDLLITDYVSQLTVVEGVIILSEKNGRILAGLDDIMTQFKETFADDAFLKLGQNMLKMTDLTSDYFRVMTGGDKIIANITEKLAKYKATVGIDAKGNILKGSFLDNLASTPELKSAISKYMRTAVSTEMDYRKFATGLKDLIKGSEGANGAMTKYVGTYAHDTFFQQARQQDNFFAELLGIDNYLWEGAIIKTSRQWCIDHHGKEYTREEIDAMDSEEWDGKIPDVPVFDQVGGYGCQHMLRPVTSEFSENQPDEGEEN